MTRNMTAILMVLSATALANAAPLTTSSGPGDVERLSGYGADVEVSISLSRGKALTEIAGHANDHGTCAISIEGKRIALNADYESHTAGRCAGSSKEIFASDARYNHSINGLRVCTSHTPIKTITGIEIESLPIYENGDFGAQGPRDRDYDGTNCDRWHTWSRCDAREVMVGFVVHFTRPADEFSGTGFATGIEAICQDVEVKP